MMMTFLSLKERKRDENPEEDDKEEENKKEEECLLWTLELTS
jgi:hypothetical protein